ncbi:THAP-type domain-containing protein [Aphis craccivora]|uniref:THAP-type domain-containing protein n=1 Tax=Aphis craccivora TaxID=307492 RepID=A0A6G0VTX9_APHCR|nr:THAP-type domain-containing protein [Aphis craccivora]
MIKLIDGKLILKSQRAIGFLGFLVSFSSLMNLKKYLIDTNKIDFLPLYKLSQDHLEMFFGNIRSQGGYNNNPTARQFKSASKKIMVNSQIKDRGFGNYIVLEDISILNCSSVSNNLINIINDTNVTLNRDIELEPEKYNIEDHGFHLPLSSFSKEVTIYIASFISHKLASKIKCDICVNSLFGIREDFLMSLIDLKNRGGLSYPSNDIIKICILTEKIIKLYYNDIIKLNKLFIQNKTFAHFIDNEGFTSLNSHDNIHTVAAKTSLYYYYYYYRVIIILYYTSRCRPITTDGQYGSIARFGSFGSGHSKDPFI